MAFRNRYKAVEEDGVEDVGGVEVDLFESEGWWSFSVRHFRRHEFETREQAESALRQWFEYWANNPIPIASTKTEGDGVVVGVGDSLSNRAN